MHHAKTVTFSIVLFTVSVIFVHLNTVKAAAFSVVTPADIGAKIKPDTGKTRARRITNREFNAAYEQNLRVSSAGQEFFGPNKTLLVADLSPNFVLI